jgi:mannose-6-phosphate isomerase
VLLLDNPVRDYAWGSASDIPEFLGITAEGGPVAALWIGAHPDSPSRVARDVHPGKQHAERAYAAQQQALDAPRDYTDDNHKPELICALRDGFMGLCGFRPVPDSRHLLAALSVAGLAEISDRLACANPASGLRNAVTSVLTSETDKAPLIAAVRRACERVAAAGGAWGPACAAYAAVAASYPADPGALVALLLNYVELAAGEAVFVGAGVPHCYLRGFGAELMACSDNVLRAGLTSKRVNVPELLRVLDFRPAELAVLCPMPSRGEAPGREADEPGAVYQTPVDDFRLSRLDLSDQPTSLPDGGPQILLCIAGAIRLRDGSGSLLELTRGQSAYLSACDTGVSIAGRGTVLRATTGAAASPPPSASRR